MEIIDLISHIRTLINDTRKQGQLLSDRTKWIMLCASLDAIQDVQSAIVAYKSIEEDSSTGTMYLQLYGLLQAMVVQQDATGHLSKSLGIPFKLDRKLKNIREIRNDSIGHPTHRGRRAGGAPDCYCMIVQPSLRKFYFEYLRSTPTAEGIDDEFVPVDINDLISIQEKLIIETLQRVIGNLEEEENTHRKKYRDKKLENLFPAVTGYYFQKLHDALTCTKKYGLGALHIELIRNTVEEFKSSLIERSCWDNCNSVKYHYDNVKHPIEEISAFFDKRSNSSLTKKDVMKLVSYLQDELRILKTIAKEIDHEYTTPIERP